MADRSYHYKDCGLDYVYLLNSFITKEARYGKGTAIVDADGLHNAIARHVVTSPRPICGQAVRFLRSVLKLTQTSFARAIGVGRSTVACWESEPHKPLEEIAAMAVRYTYAAEQDEGGVIKGVVAVRRAEDDAEADQETEHRMSLSSKNGWHRAAA